MAQRTALWEAPCEGQVGSPDVVSLWDQDTGVRWCQDARILAGGGGRPVRLCAAEWAPLGEATSCGRGLEDKLTPGSREEEGTEVRAVTVPERAGGQCGCTEMAEDLKGWPCGETRREQTWRSVS